MDSTAHSAPETLRPTPADKPPAGHSPTAPDWRVWLMLPRPVVGAGADGLRDMAKRGDAGTGGETSRHCAASAATLARSPRQDGTEVARVARMAAAAGRRDLPPFAACQFIAGDPKIDPAICGAPSRAGSSYCETHHRVCFLHTAPLPPPDRWRLPPF